MKKIVTIIALLSGLVIGTASIPTSAAWAGESPQVIKITASRFQFSPNEITLQEGQSVTLQLTSADRVHGFMLRALKIDTDIEPGKTKAITITPQAAGTFKAICDHYCGTGHGNMKMTIVVEAATARVSDRNIVSASDTVRK